MTAKDILNKHTCNGRIRTNFGILQAMEEYATQQVQEMKEELDKAVSLLLRCDRVYLPEVLQDQINEFLTSKQQP